MANAPAPIKAVGRYADPGQSMGVEQDVVIESDMTRPASVR
jgi:hypothetical protein